MIDKKLLLKVKKIVVHKNCSDGLSSAMICKDVLPNAEVFFADHKAKEYLEMEAKPGLLFCDIGPPPKRAAEFMRSKDGIQSIILDHHKGTHKVVRRFEQVGLGVNGNNDDAESGAVLAYKHVWLTLEENANTSRVKVSRVAKLAGIRDTWKDDDPEWHDAILQSEALSFYPVEYFLNNHPVDILPGELEIAKVMHDKFQSILKRTVEEACIINWNNIKVAIIPGHRVISDASSELIKVGVSVTLAFVCKVIDGKRMITVSVRSDARVFDCNKFAKNYGGGGHIPSAGGITIDVKDDTLNPWAVIEGLLNEYGKECMINQ